MLLVVTQTATPQVLSHAHSHDQQDSHGEEYHLQDHTVSVQLLTF